MVILSWLQWRSDSRSLRLFAWGLHTVIKQRYMPNLLCEITRVTVVACVHCPRRVVSPRLLVVLVETPASSHKSSMLGMEPMAPQP